MRDTRSLAMDHIGILVGIHSPIALKGYNRV